MERKAHVEELFDECTTPAELVARLRRRRRRRIEHGRTRAEAEAGAEGRARRTSKRSPRRAEQGEKLKEELDDLLDEIDSRARGQRRGVRPSLRAEGRPVATCGACRCSSTLPRADDRAVPAVVLRTRSSTPARRFVELLRQVRPSTRSRRRIVGSTSATPLVPPTSRTARTVVAIRYADGVVMAGDRRATAGNTDRHRRHREGVPGRRLLRRRRSPARPARRSRWCKLFQVQLEHYEKVEGEIAQPRGQGQPARPDGARPTCPRRCRASSSCRSSPATTSAATAAGVFSYDVTGGTLRGADFQANGSGSVHARNWIKAGWREGIDADDDRSTSRSASLFAAADEDVATGGPDLVRGIFPIVAIIDADGLPRARPTTTSRPAARARCSGGARATEGRREPMSMPFYVSPEQVMKDRADYARKGIARGRSLVALRVRRRRRCIVAENPSRTLSQDQRDLRPHRVRRRRQVQRVPAAARRRRAPRRPQGLLVLAARTSTRAGLANAYAQTLGQVFTHEMKPYEVEILVAEVGDDPTTTTRAVPHPLRRHRHGRAGLHRARRPGRADQRGARRSSTSRGMSLGDARQARREGARRRRRRAHRRPARGRAARPHAHPPRVPPHQQRRARSTPRHTLSGGPAPGTEHPALPRGAPGRSTLFFSNSVFVPNGTDACRRAEPRAIVPNGTDARCSGGQTSRAIVPNGTDACRPAAHATSTPRDSFQMELTRFREECRTCARP